MIIGKRIPIGMAVNGALTFAAYVYNMNVPTEQQLSIAAVGGLGIFLTAMAQVIVVNYFGVTGAPESKI